MTHLGFTPGREHPLDDEQVGFINLAKRTVYPLLAGAGWTLRMEGEDGLGCLDHVRRNLRIIHSLNREADEQVWCHLSLSRRDRKMPTWEQTRDVFREVCGDDALGVIVVPPADEHVNMAEVAHVWSCLTARPIPDFTRGTGSI